MTRFDLLYWVLTPLAAPLYLWKLWRKRRPIGPLWERISGPFLSPGERPRIWVHSVSVGEVLAARTLVAALEAALPEHDIVVSASTETGRDVAAKNFGTERTFPCPLDYSGSVRKAMQSVKPDLIVLMELEIWPNMLLEAQRRGVPVAVVNGRITEKSARGYCRFSKLLKGSMERVGLYSVQTTVYAERFKAIGVPSERVKVLGNMKYDAVASEPVTAEVRAATRRRLGLAEDALVLVGGSTHPGEEKILLDLTKKLAGDYPDLRLVLVPRHTNRAEDLCREITNSGWKLRRRSKMSAGSALLKSAQSYDQVLLVDTMGELADVYRAADIVFVGGSLIPHGGQNMMEPAGLGLPVLYGLHTENFTETVELLNRAEGGLTVRDPEALESELRKLIIDEDHRLQMGRNARDAILNAQGATAINVELLMSLLSKE